MKISHNNKISCPATTNEAENETFIFQVETKIGVHCTSSNAIQ